MQIPFSKAFKTILLVVLVINLRSFSAFAQNDSLDKVRHREALEAERTAYRNLDVSYGGIGFSFSRPVMPKVNGSSMPWVGIDVLSDIITVKFATGRVSLDSAGYDPGMDAYVNQGSVGMSFPLTRMTFGTYNSNSSLFRGHPVIGGELGYIGFRNQLGPSGDPYSRIYYLGINPGYRVRLPFGSLDFNLNLFLGVDSQSRDNVPGIGMNPSLTFRLDALKWRYDPDYIDVDATITSIRNVQKSDPYISKYELNPYSGIEAAEVSVDYTYDVSVQKTTMGVQDIGAHVGFGPKFSYINPVRTDYIPASYMVGVVGEGRFSYFDGGVTLEAGRVGHGGALETKSESEGTYRRRLIKSYEQGQGHLGMVNMYVNYGLDLSPLILGLMGYTLDMGDATSFFAITGGFISGLHVPFAQSFNDDADAAFYQNRIDNNVMDTKEQYLSPAVIKPGYLAGYYLAFQVGAMCAKISNYRYFGAPFASNTMLSLAYRIPRADGLKFR